MTALSLPPLPAPPDVKARVVADRGASSFDERGFVNLRRLSIEVVPPAGSPSPPIAFDIATRRAIDAVIIVAYFYEGEDAFVYLRSCPRPALMLHLSERDEGDPRDGNLWELAAGLIEPSESPARAAQRELLEELGFRVDEGALVPLGPPSYPAPGFIAERHHTFRVEVDPSRREAPTEDGSPLERDAAILTCRLDEALAHCRAGALPDAKTELALRRLREVLP